MEFSKLLITHYDNALYTSFSAPYNHSDTLTGKKDIR